MVKYPAGALQADAHRRSEPFTRGIRGLKHCQTVYLMRIYFMHCIKKYLIMRMNEPWIATQEKNVSKRCPMSLFQWAKLAKLPEKSMQLFERDMLAGTH